MSPLYNDGIRKVLNGTTTIEEVFRVAKRVEN
jgi:type II secretory ATPase GspE/PulE/Tfp pilus assembly ATPase PilB-like protein